MAKLSVIVPVYNVEKYLIECMQSLQTQTLSDIEIICVNDCSTDGSGRLLDEFAKRDERIRVIHLEQNGGVSVARNTGLDMVTSEYIMFCDPDDFYAPNMCEKMYRTITTKNVDMAICGVHVVYEADAHMRISDSKSFDIPNAVLSTSDKKLYSLHCGMPYRIFKRQIITAHNIRFPVGLRYEDMYFANVYYLWSKKIACISDRLYNYRRRAGSIMHTSYRGQTNASLDFIKIAIAYFDYIHAHKIARKHLKYFWTNLFIKCATNAIAFTGNKKFHAEIFDICNEFIKKNYKFGKYGVCTDYIIHLILRRRLSTRRRYLFRTICIYDNGTKYELSLFGVLCVYKKKFVDDHIKYYLFGIPVFTA